MSRLPLLAAFALVLPACHHNPAPDPSIHGLVINPPTPWVNQPAPSGTTFGPRGQVYKPGGGGSYPDTGSPRDGAPTGLVWFGPSHSDGSGVGAANSTATSDFDCGTGAGGRCAVKFAVGGGSGAFPHEPHERLVVTLQLLNAQGQPTGAAAVREIPGNSGGTVFELELAGCGKVRVTIGFKETVGPANPAGINTKFSAQISQYGCRH